MRMNGMTLAAVAVLSLAACAAGSKVAKGAALDPELQRFQGTWLLVAAEMDGKPVADEHIQQSRLTYVGDQVELLVPHQHREVIVATILALDPSKSPAQLKWVRSKGPFAGVPTVAIYQFEGPDQVKVCLDPSGKTLPARFGTDAGSGHVWQTWKRVPAAK
jgi:uncharacterized protein (TIGR03067 family)